MYVCGPHTCNICSGPRCDLQTFLPNYRDFKKFRDTTQHVKRGANIAQGHAPSALCPPPPVSTFPANNTSRKTFRGLMLLIASPVRRGQDQHGEHQPYSTHKIRAQYNALVHVALQHTQDTRTVQCSCTSSPTAHTSYAHGTMLLYK